MKKIFTLLFLFNFLWLQAQRDLSGSQIGGSLNGRPASLTNDDDTAAKPSPRIIIRCGATRTSENILLILNGVPVPVDTLNNLNPNDVESVTILKSQEALAIFGPDAEKGVLLIRTRRTRIFIIRDYTDQAPVPGATVTFISKNNKDTLMFGANDSGVVITKALKPDVDYSISVSAAGYRGYGMALTNGNHYSNNIFLLKRDTQTSENITLKSYPVRTIACGGGFYCRCGGVNITPQKDPGQKPLIPQTGLLVYPNPVARGGLLHIRQTNGDEKVKISLCTVDGKLLISNQVQSLKEFNGIRLNPGWAPGEYFVRLDYENGRAGASGKVIIH